MFQTIPDIQAQSITGGGQLSTYAVEQTFVFDLQTVTIGSTNAGGQLKTGKSGGGWTDVTAERWVLVGETSETTLLSRESVAGKGGTEYITTSLYFDADGNVLSGDPRIA
jgi:hypothetical protein